MWQNYLNAFLGFCLIVVAYMNISPYALVWTLSVLGIAMVVIGLWGGAQDIARRA